MNKHKISLIIDKALKVEKSLDQMTFIMDERLGQSEGTEEYRDVLEVIEILEYLLRRYREEICEYFNYKGDIWDVEIDNIMFISETPEDVIEGFEQLRKEWLLENVRLVVDNSRKSG